MIHAQIQGPGIEVRCWSLLLLTMLRPETEDIQKYLGENLIELVSTNFEYLCILDDLDDLDGNFASCLSAVRAPLLLSLLPQSRRRVWALKQSAAHHSPHFHLAPSARCIQAACVVG
jgi:hypothetical protein